MYMLVRGSALVHQPLLRHSRRCITHRTFSALVTKSQILPRTISTDYGRTLGKRYGHGKGEASQANTFMLLRWTKLLWSKMFGKYLLVTNVLGSGILMAVGDVIAQEYEYRHGLSQHNGYDGARIFRMFVAGSVQGPFHHFIYNWMDRVMPHRTMRNIINKILIDQIVMSPICILLFFYTVCSLERQTLQATNQELIGKFPYIYLMDWLTWPAAQYINFRYLDTKYRVAFVNVCTAVYNVLMSYMKHDFGIHLPDDEIANDVKLPIQPQSPTSLSDATETKR
ncbi:mpv17-like protein 2 [Drosophila hydei]|uniref:Mpv17-like protein 2 n=1 Tax=Drosophila hydei TaxID=7224 RepID=A0A6J1M2A4_DROHY|nr:mpv17-like protein 2 [Drosophila hydei]